MSKKQPLFFIFILCIVHTGCTRPVGPNYHPPKNCVSTTWQGVPQHTLEHIDMNAPLVRWWEVFQDPLLSRYIQEAARYNLDVLIAKDHICQATSMRQIDAADLYPHLGVGFNAETDTIYLQTRALDRPLPIPILPRITVNTEDALLQANWNIDLFGKTRRRIEAANAHICYTIEEAHNTRLHVMAETAKSYILARRAQEKARVAEEQVALFTKKLSIIQEQYEKGLKNIEPLEQVAGDRAKAAAQLPPLQAELFRQIYILSVMTGRPPECLVHEILPHRSLEPIQDDPVAVGMRSDLLRRRPDVRAAERQMAEATAKVGVAVASFYPSIDLTAGGGWQLIDVVNILKLSGLSWMAGAGVSLPIFEGGALKGQLHFAESSAAEAAHAYHKAVLTALQESSSAIVAYINSKEQVRLLHEEHHHIAALVNVTKSKYTTGLVDALQPLDKEHQLTKVEDNLIDAQIDSRLHLIQLYLSLGGGWEPCLQK